MNEISEILVAARKDVEEAKIPENLQEIAFKEAIRLHEAAAQPAENAGGGDGDGGTERPTPPAGDAVGQIAARLGVEAGQAEDVFDVRDGEVQLVVGYKALSEGKATATKEIALLIVGGRQGTGGEDWTSVNEIREWCKHYGKYDSANFGKTVAGMENLFRFSGKGQQREVKMRAPAWEAAGDVVRQILGGE